MAPFFSIEQHVFMIVTYCATGSPNQDQGLFRREFPRSWVPYRSKIIRNVDKCLEYGLSTNRQKDASGRVGQLDPYRTFKRYQPCKMIQI